MVRFLSYNICGNSLESDTPQPLWGCRRHREVELRRQKVVAEATAWKADLVFLQEVCEKQYTAIADALKGYGYTGYFVSTKSPSTKDPKLCSIGGTPGNYGIAVLAKGKVTDEEALDPATGVAGKTEPTTLPEKWYAACVEAMVQSVKTRACSVHLWPNYSEVDDLPVLTDLTEMQAKNLVGKEWLNTGTPVVLGGDFNPIRGATNSTRPRSSDLDALYRSELGGNGSGRFIEVDETDADHFDAPCKPPVVTTPPKNCRSGQSTHSHPTAAGDVSDGKFDYIFVDKDHFKNVAAEARPRDMDVSDHHPYRGAATFSHCNNPADNRADLLHRDAAGDLYRHFGRSNGKIAADPCKIGFGWADTKLIARAGDIDRDGDEDLYAVDANGVLLFYPGDDTELFTGAPSPVSQSFGAVNQLAVSPDMNGDGTPDLITRLADGTLSRFSTHLDGTLGAGVDLSYDFGIDDIAYDRVLAPGDISGDGKPDILARTPQGDLYLFAGKPDGTLDGRVRIGTGWNIYATVIAAGNVDGDPAGHPDLLGLKPNGDLFLYTGTGNATQPFINPPWPHQDIDRSGWGFPAGDLYL
ncbi:endonuclease/exonuclease/phosphatase family protein [Streptomyces sp. NPDC054961]